MAKTKADLVAMVEIRDRTIEQLMVNVERMEFAMSKNPVAADLEFADAMLADATEIIARRGKAIVRKERMIQNLLRVNKTLKADNATRAARLEMAEQIYKQMAQEIIRLRAAVAVPVAAPTLNQTQTRRGVPTQSRTSTLCTHEGCGKALSGAEIAFCTRHNLPMLCREHNAPLFAQQRMAVAGAR